jgi:hypothetical protein
MIDSVSRRCARPAPSVDEAAAIVAAIERFIRDTAPPPRSSAPEPLDLWHVAALREGVSRDPWAVMFDPAGASPE